MNKKYYLGLFMCGLFITNSKAQVIIGGRIGGGTAMDMVIIERVGDQYPNKEKSNQRTSLLCMFL